MDTTKEQDTIINMINGVETNAYLHHDNSRFPVVMMPTFATKKLGPPNIVDQPPVSHTADMIMTTTVKSLI